MGKRVRDLSQNKQSLHFLQKSKWFYIGLFFISTAAMILPFFFQDKLLEFKTIGFFGVFLFNFLGSATLFMPSPGILSTSIGGALYNPWLVAIVAAFGATLGECVAFLFGYAGHQVVNLKKHALLYFLTDFIFRRYGTWIVLIFSFIPNPFFDGIGILVGLSNFSVIRYIILVFIGRLGRSIILAHLGWAF